MDIERLRQGWADGTISEIKMSSGVTFTKEMLENDAMRENIFAQKIADDAFQKGISDSQARVRALEAEKANATAQPKVAEAVKQTQPTQPKATELYLLGKMTEEALAKAVKKANTMYGPKVVEKIIEAIGADLDKIVNKGEYNAPFATMFSQSFALLIAKDAETLTLFNEYKGAKTQAEVAAEAQKLAEAELLKQAAAQTTSGLPKAGNYPGPRPVRQAPAKPHSFKEAAMLAKQSLSKK